MTAPKHPAEHTKKDMREARLEEKQRLEEKRCDNCNHLLMNHKITVGVAEIKCSKCGQINRVDSGLNTK